MAASTSFDVQRLIPAASGAINHLHLFTSTTTGHVGTTIGDTSALGSFFSSAWQQFNPYDVIISVTSTYGLRVAVVTAASSTGVTIASPLTSTGVTL